MMMMMMEFDVSSWGKRRLREIQHKVERRTSGTKKKKHEEEGHLITNCK
jgi:hypothetical protein